MEEVVLKVKVEGSGDSEAKIKTVKQQLREAKEAALQAKEGTEEYFQALQKAAGLADQLKDVNEAVNTLNPGDKAAAFGTLINTVAGGFQTITGLYGLLGEKSEDVEKLLLKVQSASALAMGVQSLVEAQKQWSNLSVAIKTTTVFQKANTMATAAAAVVQKLFTGAVNTTSTSFKGLKAAIVSTGIGALVIAIGLAVNSLMEYASSTDDASSAQDDLNKELAQTKTNLEALNLLYDATSVTITARLNLAKAQGKSLEELNKLELQLFDTAAQRLKAQNDADVKSTVLNEYAIKQLKEKKDISKDEQKVLDELISKQQVYQNQLVKNQVDINNIDTNRTTLLLNQQKAIGDRNAKVVQDAEKRAKELLDKLTKNEEDITNLSKDELLKRQENAKKEYDAFVGLLRVKRDEAWAIEDATTLKIKEELQKRRDAERASDDERAAAEQQAFEDRKERIEAGFQLAQAAANSLNTLNNIITENEKRGLKEGEVLSVETQKKAFKRAQGLALIQTTINGAQAISSILGQYPKFDGGFAMVAALVSATAAIASQYAVIASQKFNPEGGGGSGSPSAPMGMNGGGGFNAPSIQPPSNTSGLIQEGENFKVYVVESDITNSQMGVQQNKKKALITI
jgi:hypothetical protein